VEEVGGKVLPTPNSAASTSTASANALKKPSFKAVAKGEVKANIPGWVLCQGGDPSKKTLSMEALTLPKSPLISP
jgi:hypothetical protein